MNRRELLKSIGLLTGGVVIGAEFLLSGCKAGGANMNFTKMQLALLDEIGETIIPTTDTPGAKAAKIGEFMKAIVSDCYTTAQQTAFTKGLETVDADCKKVKGKNFMDCNTTERHDFLISLEKEAKEFDKKVGDDEKKLYEQNKSANEKKSWTDQVSVEGLPRHYYTMMKQLTLWGYFTSKEGMTQALRYAPVPGRFDGSAPYKKGEKAWA